MNATVPVRLPEKWREEIERLAKAEDRTISSVIRRLIKAGAEQAYGVTGAQRFSE